MSKPTHSTTTTVQRPIRVTIFFAFLLLLAACGGGTAPSTDADDGAGSDATTAAATDAGGTPPTDGGSGSDDACVNTVEEVSAAFGVEITEAENTPNAGGGGALCTYFTDKAAFEVEGVETTGSETPAGGGCVYSDAGGTVLYFSIGVITTGGVPTYDASAEGNEEVGGIGDEAVYVPVDLPDGEGFQMLFRKGDVVVGIGPGSFDMLDGDLARQRAATEELARMAADRL